MKRQLRPCNPRFTLLMICAIVTALIASPGAVRAAANDAIADTAMGQWTFARNTPNRGGLTPNFDSLRGPRNIAIDPFFGTVAVADTENNRVLIWQSVGQWRGRGWPYITIGQADWTSGAPNRGGAVAANTLNGPRGVAFVYNGKDQYNRPSYKLFVADSGNHRVLGYGCVDQTCTADVVIGQQQMTTNQANRGGAATAQALYNPFGMVGDASGNLYIADELNHRVVQYASPIFSNATAAKVWGQPNTSSTTPNTGGLSASSLSSPKGLGMDSAGNLYVADTGNNRVVVYTAATNDAVADRAWGQPNLTTNTALNPPTPESLNQPTGLFVDALGDLFVADRLNNRVVHYARPLDFGAKTTIDVLGQPNGTTNTLAATSETSVNQPLGIVIDSTRNVLVADTFNHRVLTFDTPFATPTPILVTPSPTQPYPGKPLRLTVYGNRFAPDSKIIVNNVVRTTTYVNARYLETSISASEIPVDCRLTVKVQNGGTSGPLSAEKPLTCITVTKDDMYPDNLVGQPNFQTGIPNNLGLNGIGLSRPTGFAQDRNNGPFAVVDTANNRVLLYRNNFDYANGEQPDKIIGQPNMSTNLPNRGGAPNASTLSNPRAAVFVLTSLVIADSSNNRVLIYNDCTDYTCDGVADVVLGQRGMFDNGANSDVGRPLAWTLSNPFGLATGNSGRDLFVADEGNNRVLYFTDPMANRTANFVYGQNGSFTANAPNMGGAPSAQSLNGPKGIEQSYSYNRLYVADANNNRVLVYNVGNATATTVLGQPDFTSNLPNRRSDGGAPTAATLWSPTGVSMQNAVNDPHDDVLYVADRNNNRVLGYTNAGTLVSGAAAKRFYGQRIGTDNRPNMGGTAPTRYSLNAPLNVFRSPYFLLIADSFNHRVLIHEMTPVNP